MNENVSRGLIDLLSLRGRGYIAVIEAYLDESGTHRGADALCVACYVGNKGEWYKFEKEWQKTLNDNNISYFHAKDPKCNILKLPLATAIDKRKFMAFVCSVNPIIFENHHSKHFKSILGNAYACCAFNCAAVICKWAEDNKLGPVSIAFEAGQPNEEFVYKTLHSLIGYKDFCISGVMAAKKEDFLPLQSADFLAHSCTSEPHWFQYLMNKDNRFSKQLKATDLSEQSMIVTKILNHHRRLKHAAKKGGSSF